MNAVLSRLKRPLLYLMAPAYIVAGVLHFVVPELYVQIVPPVFPVALALVYLSGIAEIGITVGLEHRQHDLAMLLTRRPGCGQQRALDGTAHAVLIP